MTRRKYLEMIIDLKRQRPDDERCFVLKIYLPTNVSTLQAFLGFVNYYSIYVSNIYKWRPVLNNLLKKRCWVELVKWMWKIHKKIIEILNSDLLLTHHNPKQDIVVASCASDTNIDAVILHKFRDGKTKAIEHTSRTLLAVEKKYSQIEKEAIIFDVKSFIWWCMAERLFYYKRTTVRY